MAKLNQSTILGGTNSSGTLVASNGSNFTWNQPIQSTTMTLNQDDESVELTFDDFKEIKLLLDFIRDNGLSEDYNEYRVFKKLQGDI